MPKTKLTRDSWKNHMHYSKYVYVIIALLAWFVVDMTYTMTEYRPPKERKVEIQLVGEYADAEPLKDVAAQALGVGQAFDETLEVVEFFPLMYSGQEDDMYGAQKYMVMVAAQEGHIYFLNRPLMEQMVMQGGALSLDEYIESGVLDPGDADLSTVTYNAPDLYDEDGATLDERHVYALPLSELGTMLSLDTSYDIRDKYAIIMSYSPNPDTVAVVLASVMEQLEGPMPEWLKTADEIAAEEAEQEAALAGEPARDQDNTNADGE